MATEGNGDPPVLDFRTMEELCQPSLNGQGGAIAPIVIQATNFGLKNDMIQQVQNSCQFHGLPGDDANKHLDKFLHLRNEITNFHQPDESLFEAWERYKLSIDQCPNHNMFLVTQIDTFYNGLTLRHHDTVNVPAGRTFMKRRPEECYDLIENMTAHHNDWDTLAQWSESSSSIASSSDLEIVALIAEMAKINKNLMRVLQVNQQVKAVTPNCETYGGPHSYNDSPAIVGQTQNVYAAGAYQSRNSYQPQGASHGPNPPLGYQAPAYQAPGYQAPVHQPLIPQPQVLTTVEFTNYMKADDVILKNKQTNITSLKNPSFELKNMFGQFMKMNTASSSGSGTLPSNTITNPKEDLKGITTRSETAYQGPMIPTTSSSLPKVVERKTEVTKDTVPPTNNGSTKDVQPSVVQTESLILNFKPVVASLIEPVAAPVNAPKPNQKPSIPYPSRFHDQKLRDKANDQKEKFFQIFQDLKFNISFADALILMPKFGPTIKTLLTNKDKLSDLTRTPLNEHLLSTLTDLCASINLMPLSVWNKLSLPKLSPTYMTLELADRLISRPVGVAEDDFVKVGTFHFPADFVVVDFDTDPRVPLFLERSFLKTRRALIDVFRGELTLHVGKEAITFNLDQTLRYSTNYNDMMANRLDVIDMACEEYSQEVLSFSDVVTSGNPTPYYDPIISTSSPTLNPFGDSDFLLEEVDAFLVYEDDPTSPEVDHSYFDTEGDIFLLEAFLNDDLSLPPPNQGNYLPQVRKELKICEAKNDKSLIDEPPEVKLKDLPPYLEYAFLEGENKLPVIIAKDLSVKEKVALIKVLKSHKQGIAWKLSDIKGINLKFCTHKILMEDDFEPTVQHQRRSLGKPRTLRTKKGGFTVIENEENKLIPTRLVMRWRVCIIYRKFNEATRKDHFPLPVMDQMLERLVGNEYCCILDGFLGYFQIPIDPKDQEKTTFTCPYGTFAYRRFPFGLCNAPGTFQRCMMAIFHDMIEKIMEVFMDDFSIFGNSFQTCLSHLEKMLKRCEDTNLCPNWEKSHFMVKEGIVLGHKISKNGMRLIKPKSMESLSYLIPLPSRVSVAFLVMPASIDDSFKTFQR
uniref:Reverse transcriptase domain-containing protein n=1 Tax=Tanacetum cinerariifolium TaxID=118510 RepID=A0A6L2M146_TANCI|nr:reverse transcriptase domain-containing protein [Tanacetum cinerariifolium]